MALPYQELYYSSTQQSILTGADGFGVRTYSEGLPKEIIERLKSKHIFVYNSGPKPLAGIFDLLQNPGLVLEYPKTFTFFKEEAQGQLFYIFTRTVFIGRDYGWYLTNQEESARSGNLFCHIIFIKEKNFELARPDSIFQALLKQFKPHNYRNDPGNEELRQLLTNNQGAPILLPTVDYAMFQPQISPQIFEHLEQTALAVYTAFETQRRVVVVQREEKTQQHILVLLACLPRFVVKAMGFVTNFQDFNLYTESMVIFINEFYQHEIPVDHPYLMICDYQTGKFPTLPESDFLEHIGQLIRSGRLEELQIINEGFDSMVESFTEGMSFNQLFYAWVYLLSNNDRYASRFQPADVIRNIKDYPLTSAFRKSIEDVAFESFKEALEAEQHVKVASSLQLLADLKLKPGLWKEAQRYFSSYFFKSDNAAALFRYSTEEELVFNALSLEEQEANISNFIATSSLPVGLLEFFLRKFCEVMPFDTIEGILYLAVLDRQSLITFGNYLEQSWGKERYWRFLEEHDFFIGMGESHQVQFFGTDTKRYLQDMAKEGAKALELVWLKTEKAVFFHQYLDIIIEKAADPKSSTPYLHKIALLDYYSRFVLDGIRQFSPTQTMVLLLDMILENFNWNCHKDCIEPLTKTILRLEKVAGAEKNALTGKNAAVDYLRRLGNYIDIVRFIDNVLGLRQSVDSFITIMIPQPYKKDAHESYVRFMLATLQMDVWCKPVSTQKLCRYFFKKFKGEKFRLQDEVLALPEFIPLFYQDLMTSFYTDDSDLEDKLSQFHALYIQTLWSLRREKKGDAEDDAKLQSHQIKTYSVVILNHLKDRNKAACRQVVEFIANDMADRDTDFIEYVQSNVHTGSAISGFFKRFSPFKKD